VQVVQPYARAGPNGIIPAVGRAGEDTNLTPPHGHAVDVIIRACRGKATRSADGGLSLRVPPTGLRVGGQVSRPQPRASSTGPGVGVALTPGGVKKVAFLPGQCPRARPASPAHVRFLALEDSR